MQLLDHVSITVRNLDAVREFYKSVFSTLGVAPVYEEADAIGFGTRNDSSDDSHSYISIFQSAAAAPDARRHCCFRAGSAEQVRKFHSTGLAAGGSDQGLPGLRSYHDGYYAAFISDPEGNRLEAVYHGGPAAK